MDLTTNLREGWYLAWLILLNDSVAAQLVRDGSYGRCRELPLDGDTVLFNGICLMNIADASVGLSRSQRTRFNEVVSRFDAG
jgi:hypothetical protein